VLPQIFPKSEVERTCCEHRRWSVLARRDAEDIKRFALANAPAYQHPRFVWFVDRLPLSSTNKIDRSALELEAAGRVVELQRT
jgi:acyl-CoA synthetase (AMP-forming)/AMP-acid ligase II